MTLLGFEVFSFTWENFARWPFQTGLGVFRLEIGGGDASLTKTLFFTLVVSVLSYVFKGVCPLPDSGEKCRSGSKVRMYFRTLLRVSLAFMCV